MLSASREFERSAEDISEEPICCAVFKTPAVDKMSANAPTMTMLALDTAARPGASSVAADGDADREHGAECDGR
jgi:hypothetical protein